MHCYKVKLNDGWSWYWVQCGMDARGTSWEEETEGREGGRTEGGREGRRVGGKRARREGGIDRGREGDRGKESK